MPILSTPRDEIINDGNNIELLSDVISSLKLLKGIILFIGVTNLSFIEINVCAFCAKSILLTPK